ncbi:MAG: hypothetical protein ACRD4B_04980, partial [Acidobacteriota bacterium]
VIIEGRLSDKEGETKLLADNAWPLTKKTLVQLGAKPPHRQKNARTRARTLRVHLPSFLDRSQLETVQSILREHHLDSGELPVELLLPRHGTIVRVRTPYRVTPDAELETQLKAIVGSKAIERMV